MDLRLDVFQLMPSFDSSKSGLHYSLHAPPGRGTSDVVLLHGLGSCGEDWSLQIPELSRNYRVITPDLPGHGRSGVGSVSATVLDMSRAVSELLNELGGGAAHVVGLSLGGAVALQLAIDRPSQVRSLTAVNTFARLRLSRRGLGKMVGRLILLMTGQMDWLGDWVAGGLFPGEGQTALRQAAAARIAGNPWRAYLRAALAVSRFDCRRRLGDIRAPTLVVAGEKDTTVPLKAKLELASRIPGARLEIIPGSGHVTPVDAAGRFNAVLLRFFEAVESSGEDVGHRKARAEIQPE